MVFPGSNPFSQTRRSFFLHAMDIFYRPLKVRNTYEHKIGVEKSRYFLNIRDVFIGV